MGANISLNLLIKIKREAKLYGKIIILVSNKTKLIMKKLGILFLLLISVSGSIIGQNLPKGYESVEGKIVGIWPHTNKFYSQQQLERLKDYFGFNYLLIAAPYGEEVYKNAKAAGYDSLHIMKQIYIPDYLTRNEWFWNNINSLGKVWAYYFDEPLSRNFSFVTFAHLLVKLNEKHLYPKAGYVVSELDEKKAARFLRLTSSIMYSGYGAKEKLGADQIKTWNEWGNYLGPTFSMLWIGAHEDYDEYSNLLNAAKAQNFNSIWLYQYEPLDKDKEIGDDNIIKFCEAAADAGYLKRKK